jgi:hypothetical protein
MKIKGRTARLGALAMGIGATISLLGQSTAGASYQIEDLVSPLPTYESFSVASSQTTTQQWTTTDDVKVLQGDFNGDLHSDFFFYGTKSAPDGLWLSKPLAKDETIDANRFTQVAVSVNGVYQPFVGDFDGNGSDDIFWYAPGGGADSIWYFSGGTVMASVNQTVNGFYKPTVADFDQNDGVPSDDIFWYGEFGGESVWSGRSNRTFQTRSFGDKVPAHGIVLVGNFTADHNSEAVHQETYFPDLFFYVPGTTADALWSGRGDGTFSVTTKTVNGTYTPIVGTFHQPGQWPAEQLDDIFWYTAGKASDTAWMNNGAGFTSYPLNVNGTYKPFVIEGYYGADTLVWNNPAGGDAVWQPNGAQGTWHYEGRSWPGADMGSRTPYVGLFDDYLDPLLQNGGHQEGPTLNVVTSSTTSTTTVSFRSVLLPRSDVFWFSTGNGAGQSEVLWQGAQTSLTSQITTYDNQPT